VRREKTRRGSSEGKNDFRKPQEGVGSKMMLQFREMMCEYYISPCLNMIRVQILKKVM
jgi:hypothetical protein